MATNLSGESVESMEASATPLAAPVGLAATPGALEVTLDWGPVAGATSYNLYWATTPGVTKATGTPILGATSPHVHGGLVDGLTYYYVATAVNGIGGGAESVESSEISATPTVIGAPDPSFNGQGWINLGGTGGGNGDDRGRGIALDGAGKILVAGSTSSTGGVSDMTVWRVNDDGTLDVTFNGQGWLVHNIGSGGGGDDAGHGIILGPTGLIVVSGFSSSPGGNLRDGTAWRFLDDASLDVALNSQGWVVDASAKESVGFAVALDASGMILLAGFSRASGGDDNMTVWRYDSDGNLDTAFNGQGWVVHDDAAGGAGVDRAEDIVIDASGRILATGWSVGPAGDEEMVIWRLNADGSLDTAFDGRGWVVHSGAAGGAGEDLGKAIELDGSGRILVAGSSRSGAGNLDMVIWRYNSDGTIDGSFNAQGWTVHDGAAGGADLDEGRDIVLDAQGRILVTGSSWNAAGTADMAIWRYNPDGTLDGTFNSQGWIVHDNASGGAGYDVGRALALDSTGRILITGSSTNASGSEEMVIWRFK